jgi:hypothetical protein
VFTEPKAVITITARSGLLLAQRGEQREAVHLRHLHVDDGEVDQLGAREVEGLPRLGRGEDDRPLVAQDVGQQATGDRVVVDDQDARHAGSSGRRTRTVVPCPSSLLDGDDPTVLAGDALDDGEARPVPRPGDLVVLERLEDVRSCSSAMPMPSSLTASSSFRSAPFPFSDLGMHGHRTGRLDRIDRVGEQVHEQLAEPGAIGLDLRQIVGKLAAGDDVPSLQASGDHLERLGHQRRDRDRSARRRAAAGSIEQAPDRLDHALHLRLEDLELAGVLRGELRAAQELGIAEDRVERRAELVREGRRHLPERRPALAARGFELRRAQAALAASSSRFRAARSTVAWRTRDSRPMVSSSIRSSMRLKLCAR